MHDHHGGDAYIRRLDPDYIELVSDVADVKTQMQTVTMSMHRTERYLVGGWNEAGDRWVTGVREKVDEVLRKNEENRAQFRWLVGGVWAIFLIAIARIMADYVPWLHAIAPTAGPHA